MTIPWRKSEPGINQKASSCHCFVVCKRIKWEFPMVFANPTFTNSSKWHGIKYILPKQIWIWVSIIHISEATGSRNWNGKQNECLIQYLNKCIVEHQASWWCFCLQSSLQLFILGEGINCKRFRLWIYEFYAVFNLVQLSKQRQNSL